MAYKTNPELLQALRIIASKLPMVNCETRERHLMLGKEILELETVKEIDGKPINPEKHYLMIYPVFIISNHYRRLKRAWIKNGREGVQHYISQIELLKNRQTA